MSDFALRFLTREGCHLCDDAWLMVTAESARRRIPVVKVDIDKVPTLSGQYGSRVPVVLGLGDVVLTEGPLDRRQFRRVLRNL